VERKPDARRRMHCTADGWEELRRAPTPLNQRTLDLRSTTESTALFPSSSGFVRLQRSSPAVCHQRSVDALAWLSSLRSRVDRPGTASCLSLSPPAAPHSLVPPIGGSGRSRTRCRSSRRTGAPFRRPSLSHNSLSTRARAAGCGNERRDLAARACRTVLGEPCPQLAPHAGECWRAECAHPPRGVVRSGSTFRGALSPPRGRYVTGCHEHRADLLGAGCLRVCPCPANSGSIRTPPALTRVEWMHASPLLLIVVLHCRRSRPPPNSHGTLECAVTTLPFIVRRSRLVLKTRETRCGARVREHASRSALLDPTSSGRGAESPSDLERRNNPCTTSAVPACRRRSASS